MYIQPFYTRLLLVVAAVVGALNIGALGIGFLRPAHPALAGFYAGCGGIPQPCWYGIAPGTTTVDEARLLLGDTTTLLTPSSTSNIMRIKLGDGSGICMLALETSGNLVDWIKIEYCADISIQVGDVIAVMGLPERILGTGREIGYGGVKTNSFGWWSPFDHTQAIGLRPASIDSKAVIWRGFVPKWRYCAIEVGTPGCQQRAT